MVRLYKGWLMERDFLKITLGKEIEPTEVTPVEKGNFVVNIFIKLC